jgi:tetratricopeptide (TPR) repeat protein
MVCIYADELQAALDALATAHRLAPYPPSWLHYQTGLALLWNGDLVASAEAAERYRSLVPDDPYAYALLATIHAFAGREAEAAAMIRELRRRDPSFGVAHLRRSQHYKDPAKLDRVLEVLRRAGLLG